MARTSTLTKKSPDEVLKVLNEVGEVYKAAVALGCSPRTLYTYVHKMGMKRILRSNWICEQAYPNTPTLVEKKGQQP